MTGSNRSQSYSTFKNTPILSVLDSRRLAVAEVLYHRHPEQLEIVEARITRHAFSASGQHLASIDPRLHAHVRRDGSYPPNIRYQRSLAGKVLSSDSVDAGRNYQLDDALSRPALSLSATGVKRTWAYLANQPADRVSTVTEHTEAGAGKVIERFIWATPSASQQALNLIGRCVRHYDTGGLHQRSALSINGAVLYESRRLLRGDSQANWQGTDEQAWNALLDTDALTHQYQLDATDTLITQIDPQLHRQRIAYDRLGLQKASWLRLNGQVEQPVVIAQHYSESGQLLRKEQGNGVLSTFTYDPCDLRLVGVRVERPAGHRLGAQRLQDLRYSYDPAGNVTAVEDTAQATRFWRNQQVPAQSRFVYDSLYQLVSASGRECASHSRQGAPSTPMLLDDGAVTLYTRTYQYDRAGNLVRLRHSAPASGNNYTRHITVATSSNRAVPGELSEDPNQVDCLFDAAGHQLHLRPGQPLSWTPRGQLQSVTALRREGQMPDDERYQYTADGQRISKRASAQGGAQQQTRRTVYLRDLELHTQHVGETLTQQWQTISVGAPGSGQLRALLWTQGKPDGVDNGALRYSYDDLIGSGGLEVDGEGALISREEYYPFGGTAVWAARNELEACYKTVRYSGKECDASGLYYYGHRYYQPWACRWLSADPAGTIDGLNLFRMVRNNPMTLRDADGLEPSGAQQPNGLYAPKLRTGASRNRKDASIAETPADIYDFPTLHAQPVPLRDVLSDGSQASELLVTDLLAPQKVSASAAYKATITNLQGGGQLLFGALKMTDQGRSYNALVVTDPSAAHPVAASEYAYWAPQGGYVDIPIHPSQGQPELVITPGFSGCTLAVDQMDGQTLRVRHVQGFKEDDEYNNLSSGEHGLGMVNAMEYFDYGYHQDSTGATIENIQATAFMRYDRSARQWSIHHQNQMNPPGISKIENTTTGLFKKQVTRQVTARFSKTARVISNHKIALKTA